MFSRFFIEHPIFATVVSLVIVIAGGVSMVLLPVEQYPRITPVQVTVQAKYPGADSQTLADSVEQQDTELGLEVAQRAARGRLRHGEALGRAGEIPEARRGQENLQLTERVTHATSTSRRR